VAGEVAQLRFALRRLAHGGGDRRGLAVAGAAAGHAAGRLDALVLGPLRAEVGDRPLVVSPTGPLHALPWAALPSCAGRPVTVVPSAGLWLRAAGPAADAAPGAGPGRVALAAGPGLPRAAEEIAALRARYPDAGALTGESASVEAVLAAIDGAGLAHVAAHGRFRADNPLLSSLWLADGPLTVYDLETLARPPRALVLPACDAGLTDVRPGGELMGLAAALLTLGARTLVAPVVPIPDDAAMPMMVRFHDALLAGAGHAEALAVAAAAAPPDDPAARSFICLGAG
jgi:CHAT domain-containing protein